MMNYGWKLHTLETLGSIVTVKRYGQKVGWTSDHWGFKKNVKIVLLRA
jgi:hypothetical protein